MSKQENQNPSDPKHTPQSGGGQPQSVSLQTYILIEVPAACSDFHVGDSIDVYVTNPPPQRLTLYLGGDCDGSIGELQS